MIKSNFWGKMIYIMVSGQLPQREIAPWSRLKFGLGLALEPYVMIGLEQK